MEDSFKMEGLLKLKKFKEQNEKIKLGKVLKKIDKEENEIKLLNENLEEMYDFQSNNLEKKINKSYSTMIEGTREQTKNHYEKLEKLKKDYEQSRKKLNVILGEVKVLQNMKDEHERVIKKKIALKREREIEDIVNMRRGNG